MILRILSLNKKMSNINQLYKNLSQYLSSQTTNLDETQIYNLIETFFGMITVSSPKLSNKLSNKPSPKFSKSTKKTDNTLKCEYIFIDGKKKGDQCSSKGKNEHEGKMYCGTHIKLATKTEVKKSLTKSSKKIESDEKVKNLIDTVINNKAALHIRQNKYGNYMDMSTNIVFNKENKMAIGNQLDNGLIGPLTKEQIDICEQNNFPFIKEIKKDKIPSPPPKKEESDSESDEEDIEDDKEEVEIIKEENNEEDVEDNEEDVEDNEENDEEKEENNEEDVEDNKENIDDDEEDIDIDLSDIDESD